MGIVKTTARLATVTLGIGVLATGALAAQEVDLDKAEALEAKAAELLNVQDDWNSAAKLLREAASHRPDGDAQARQDLYQASRIAYYRGQERRAVNDLEHLADRALEEGDVLTAAHALADAAWIAHEEGMGTKTLDLSERAQKLALSPLITETQRATLQERFGLSG